MPHDTFNDLVIDFNIENDTVYMRIIHQSQAAYDLLKNNIWKGPSGISFSSVSQPQIAGSSKYPRTRIFVRGCESDRDTERVSYKFKDAREAESFVTLALSDLDALNAHLSHLASLHTPTEPTPSWTPYDHLGVDFNLTGSTLSVIITHQSAEATSRLKGGWTAPNGFILRSMTRPAIMDDSLYFRGTATSDDHLRSSRVFPSKARAEAYLARARVAIKELNCLLKTEAEPSAARSKAAPTRSSGALHMFVTTAIVAQSKPDLNDKRTNHVLVQANTVRLPSSENASVYAARTKNDYIMSEAGRKAIADNNIDTGTILCEYSTSAAPSCV